MPTEKEIIKMKKEYNRAVEAADAVLAAKDVLQKAIYDLGQSCNMIENQVDEAVGNNNDLRGELLMLAKNTAWNAHAQWQLIENGMLKDKLDTIMENLKIINDSFPNIMGTLSVAAYRKALARRKALIRRRRGY